MKQKAEKSLPNRIIESVVKTVKGENKSLAQQRIDICGGCEQYHIGFCGICKCMLAIKIHNENEHCPLNKW